MKNYLSLILVLLLTACIPLPSSKPAIKPTEIQVKTDLATLKNRINLPQHISSAQWIVLPVGIANNNVPGPTDTVLYAVLKSSSNWSSLPQAKPSSTDQEIVRVPIPVAQKLFSPNVLKNFTQSDGYVRFTGKLYDSSFFDRSGYSGIYAILIGNSLLVCLQST
ncbi:hypothetical protein [Nostoc sp. MS1]|uniref:hypothetical protein n=1 Tax=Nostoc sp. MS1 TaxID=2764711 RepID=UPI001CC80565|nr:hypothetical protein [Nostoc sp. MS1]BCL38455.1 hypothetical protein NSMS1_49020 [Nostoc sp. MS1]